MVLCSHSPPPTRPQTTPICFWGCQLHSISFGQWCPLLDTEKTRGPRLNWAHRMMLNAHLCCAVFRTNGIWSSEQSHFIDDKTEVQNTKKVPKLWGDDGYSLPCGVPTLSSLSRHPLEARWGFININFWKLPGAEERRAADQHSTLQPKAHGVVWGRERPRGPESLCNKSRQRAGECRTSWGGLGSRSGHFQVGKD